MVKTIDTVFKELKKLDIVPDDFKLERKEKSMNFKVGRTKIKYGAIFESMNEDSLRIILLHEMGHKKVPRYSLLWKTTTIVIFIISIIPFIDLDLTVGTLLLNLLKGGLAAIIVTLLCKKIFFKHLISLFHNAVFREVLRALNSIPPCKTV